MRGLLLYGSLFGLKVVKILILTRILFLPDVLVGNLKFFLKSINGFYELLFVSFGVYFLIFTSVGEV